jgi:hypothetical protein
VSFLSGKEGVAGAPSVSMAQWTAPHGERNGWRVRPRGREKEKRGVRPVSGGACASLVSGSSSTEPVEVGGAAAWRRGDENRGPGRGPVGGCCHMGQPGKWGPTGGAQERRPVAGPAGGLSWAGWCGPGPIKSPPFYLFKKFQIDLN